MPAPVPFALALDGHPSGLYGGLYTALADGDFVRGGLALRLEPHSSGPSALSTLAAGRADAAVASEPDLLRARAAGDSLVAVGALVQGPLNTAGRPAIQRVARTIRLTTAAKLAATTPTYNGLVLVVREAEAQHDGPQLRSFLQALMRGEEAARANPAHALAALLGADRRLDRRFTASLLRATLAASFPTAPSQPFGYDDPLQWDAYARWMLAQQQLTHTPAAALAVTNEFLPGQGE